MFLLLIIQYQLSSFVVELFGLIMNNVLCAKYRVGVI